MRARLWGCPSSGPIAASFVQCHVRGHRPCARDGGALATCVRRPQGRAAESRASACSTAQALLCSPPSHSSTPLRCLSYSQALRRPAWQRAINLPAHWKSYCFQLALLFLFCLFCCLKKGQREGSIILYT